MYPTNEQLAAFRQNIGRRYYGLLTSKSPLYHPGIGGATKHEREQGIGYRWVTGRRYSLLGGLAGRTVEVYMLGRREANRRTRMISE